MRTLFLTIFTVLAFGRFAHGQIANPVLDTKNRRGLVASDTLCKWAADLNGDGKDEVFLSLKEEYQDATKIGQVPSWFVYLSKSNGSFILSTGEEDDGVLSLNPLVAIDPTHVYVGKIGQLNRHGIVTMQTDYPRKSRPVRYIYAYTVQGDHLKRTLLARYDPDKGSNAIYDRYLSDIHRTKVRLLEVGP